MTSAAPRRLPKALGFAQIFISFARLNHDLSDGALLASFHLGDLQRALRDSGGLDEPRFLIQETFADGLSRDSALDAEWPAKWGPLSLPRKRSILAASDALFSAAPDLVGALGFPRPRIPAEPPKSLWAARLYPELTADPEFAAIAGFGQSALLCFDVDISDDPLDPKASRDRRILESADLARAFFSELGVVAAIRVQGRGPLGPIEPDGSVEFSKADDVADFRSVASELQERILHASASAPKSKPRGLRI